MQLLPTKIRTGTTKQSLSEIAGKFKASKKMETELYFVITYLFGVATSYCSLDNMFRYVGRSEFKHCARIFERIRALAIRWNLGFVKSLELTADTVKSKLLCDFLERFCQMIKTGDAYDRYLMMEHEAYVASYEAEHERALKSVENLGNAYSAILTSVTFITITMTMTQSLMSTGTDSGTVMNYFVMAIIATLFISIYVLYAVSPIDKLTYLNRDLNIPEEFKRISRVLPIAISLGVVAALACIIARLELGWLIMTPFVPLIVVGFMSKKADDMIIRRENQFPTFIRTLGTTAALTSYSTARTLKLLLVRDFGILSRPVRGLYAKLSVGADPQLCWSNIASHCGSEMIRIFGGIYNATTFLGGDPGEVGKMISRNMIRMLIMRAQRIQIANGIKSLILPLHTIECVLLAFMTSLLGILIRMVNMGSGYLDLFRASLEPSSVGLLFLILSVIMAFGNAMAIKIIDIGSEYKFLYYLSLLMIITGATWIGVGFAAKLIFSDLFKFAGFSP